MLRRLLLRIAVFCSLVLLFLTSHASAQAPWTQTVRSGDIVYFALSSPTRIERYDLAGEQWLAPIPLTAALTALQVDGDAIYYARGSSVLRCALDGSGERTVYTASATVTALLTDTDYIFVFPNNSRVESVRKADLQFVASAAFLNAAFSIGPGQRHIYGVAGGSSPSNTGDLPYNADGTFASFSQTTTGESSAGKLVTWVSPDEHTLIRATGTVFSIPGVLQRATLGGAVDDVAFHGSDVTIVLRGTKLTAFDSSFFEAGTYTLPTTAYEISVRSGQLYAFGTGTNASGVAVTKVPVSSITAAQPGAVPDRSLLSFVPDDVFQEADGSLLVFSKKYQSIFRWSPSSQTYTATYRLLGTPTSAIYASALRRIYTAYSSGDVAQIKLDQGETAETPFYHLDSAPLGLAALDNIIVAGTRSISPSDYVFTRIDRDGVKQSAVHSSYWTLGLWSSVQQQIYYLSDSSDLASATVDAEGRFRAVAGISRDLGPSYPLRLSADEQTIVGGNGASVRANDLGVVGRLTNLVTDAVSRGGNWATLRVGGAQTQLQLWSSTFTSDRAFTLPGQPLRIFALPDGRLVALTTSAGDAYVYFYPKNDGRLMFSLVDPTGAGTVDSSPNITTDLASQTWYRGQSDQLAVVATGGSLTYQWRRNGADIPGATAATLDFPSVDDSAAGTYAVVVRNSLGATISKAAVIDVQTPPAAPVITTQSGDGYTKIDGAITFSVSASGPLLTYQWRRAGIPIAGATTASLNFSISGASDFTTYDVVVSNPSGTVTSQPMNLILTQASAFLTHPTNQSAAITGIAKFTVTATGAPPPSYRWARQAAGSTTFTFLSDGGVYSGVTTPTLTITHPTLAMSGDQFRCTLVNTTINSNAAVLTVTAAPAFTSATSAAFTTGVSNSFVFQASGTPAPRFTATGLPAWAALSPSGILTGTPPSAAGGPVLLQVTATNGTQPDATVQFVLALPLTPGTLTIVAQPMSQSVAPGASVTLSVAANSGSPLTYQWRKGGAPIEGATQASYTVENAAAIDGGRYSVVVSNAQGSTVSDTAVLNVIPPGAIATHALAGPGYFPGRTVTIVNTIAHPENAAGAGWQAVLPAGWTLLSSNVPSGTLQPSPGSVSLLEWAWSEIPAGPITFSYTLSVPSTTSGDQSLISAITMRLDGPEVKLLAQADPLVLRPVTFHSADLNGDYRIDLPELLRVIELYNARQDSIRTGAYRVDPTSADAFNPATIPGAGGSLTSYHNADTNHDGALGLNELTRVIQLYNSRAGANRTGAYHVQSGTEDGFAPGP